MAVIEYDPSRSALYTPEKRETIFETGQDYSFLQVAVEAARLAYIHAEVSAAEEQRLASAVARAGFGGLKLFRDLKTDTQGFGAYRSDDRTALVSFRGTQPDKVTDVATDLEAHQVPWNESRGNVHGGFAAAARSVIPQVKGWLDERSDRNRLIMTGHSLGAAIATLVASVLRPTLLITLGSPRVGDPTFALNLAGIDGARIVDCCDAVTEVPPELPIYTHIRSPTYITKDGAIVENPSAEEIAKDHLHARIEYFVKYAWRIGSVFVRDLADHAPINYARAFS
jgi:hypothetical protein